jgi:hypothetical protein
MRLLIVISWLLLPVAACLAQQDPVINRIILIGDAGELTNGKVPSVEKARALFNINDGVTSVIYLGDNIYKEGLPDSLAKDFSEKKNILDQQISLVKDTRAKAWFIPGNHDWKKSKDGGWQQILNQSHYISTLQLPNVDFLPKGGCPGPEELVVNDKLVIVFMDSQWFIEPLDKPGIESNCESQTEEEVMIALRELIAIHSDKLMLIVMHHPLYTYGPHGGYFTIKQHIFPFTDAVHGLYIPLPIIGSLYPITRGWFGTPQDRNSPKYKNLILEMEEAIKKHSNVVLATGHEHSLQYIEKDSVSFIGSGSGSKSTRVKKGKYSLFAEDEVGFAVLEITQSGKVKVNFYDEKSGSSNQPLYSRQLKDVPPKAAPVIPETFVFNFPDSATTVGSSKLKWGSGFKRMMQGTNYRKEWAEPVTAWVIDIGKEKGGLTPIRRGGGHQTKSLRLEDPTGKQWVLRGVEKTVTDASLPPEFRGTFVKDLVSDGVSASYPYSALSVPPLAEAAGIPHASPKLVYLPDDPRLGKFRTDFGNTMCLFEEREPGDFRKTVSTFEMIEKLQDDNDHRVDQHALLKARLFDMYIMDFDRHEDQWRWGVVDEDKGNKYVPVPRDRDQAFFINVGLVPWYASQPWVTPQIQGFRSKARNIKTYNFNGRNIDRSFLNEMTEEDWKKGAGELVNAMTDDVIETALAQQPDEVKKFQNQDIIRKLKERRSYYPGEMLKYYNFISKTVHVSGSNKKELFDINREKNGGVTVTVYKITKEGKVSTKMYERKFDPGITKELRLYGLGGDDKFYIHGNGRDIKIRTIGGAGKDEFENKSRGRMLAYDMNTEDNKVNGRIADKFSSKPEVNSFDRMYFKYNVWIPFISAYWNPDDGLFLGASVKHIRHGFRKNPYAQSHTFVFNHALSTQAYQFLYAGEFIHVLGSLDLLLTADIKSPNRVSNFYGYGNETVYDKTKPGEFRYYRARYDLIEMSALLRKRWKHVSIIYGPAYQFFKFDSVENAGKFITTPESGIDIADVSKKKEFIGGEARLIIDTRNNPVIPLRGIYWETIFRPLRGVNAASRDAYRVNSEFSVYLSFSRNPKVVLAARVGGGKSYGSYEYYQAQYLGGNLGFTGFSLRGFRKDRFAGESMVYNNIDLRLKIADFRTYLFPGSLGLVFFHDMGKVWVEGKDSKTWHRGYGAGFWISPMRRIVFVFNYSQSKDGIYPIISGSFHF